jgi:hypothetical protein
MKPAPIASIILLAALGWAGWEVYSLRQRNRSLEREIAGYRQRSLPADSTRTTISGTATSSAAAPAPGTGSPSVASTPSGFPTRKSGAPPEPAKDGIALVPGVQPDGSIVIGKGTSREIVVSAEEAFQLSSSLAKATADARNKGPNGASYSAGKATGPPDSPNHGGDSTGAWCPAPANGTGEWLQLKYPKNVEIAEVNIHETYATGALAKVTAVMPDGSEKTLWQGTEPVETPPVERVLKVPPGIRADQLRITLDSSRTGTWQEIDAVELVGKDGSRQWAAEATASSHWGSGSGWGSAYGSRRLEELDVTTWRGHSPLTPR